jgi:hypothetical protein
MNSANASYTGYGGRGIEYRMPDDPGEATSLLIEAIGLCPKGMTLDRINNDGHYEIGNLRWATWSEQNRNRRKWRWRFNRHKNKRYKRKYSGQAKE